MKMKIESSGFPTHITNQEDKEKWATGRENSCNKHNHFFV
jgi:hypothetical protein